MKETTLEIPNSEGNNGQMDVKSPSCLFTSRGTYIVDERFYMKADHLTHNGNIKWDDYFKLENMIYNCTEECKMCAQNMLLGRGDLFADIMFLGLHLFPNITVIVTEKFSESIITSEKERNRSWMQFKIMMIDANSGLQIQLNVLATIGKNDCLLAESGWKGKLY